MRHFGVLLLCLLAAVFAASKLFAMSTPHKKCIAFGWEFSRITPSQLLANAEKFRDTAIDGVSIYPNATNRAGKVIGSSNSTFMDDPEWDIEAFGNQIEDLKEIAATPHLNESFFRVYFAPQKRISWTDTEAWVRLSRNMAVLGLLSRITGLKGINPDTEDYHGQKQFIRIDGDPPYDQLVEIVRQRGREVFGALFWEQPEAKVLFHWFLTFDKVYFSVADPRVLAREKQDLWPAFADGIMDVLPSSAVIIDGDEHAYSCDFATGDFHMSACNQRVFAARLLSPENRAKHATQVQTSFGLYLDMYVNPGPSWYMGPIGGSQVEHFRRNYAAAFKLADEYVWLWGEKLRTIDWEDATVPKHIDSRKWSDALPGLYPQMLALNDADYGIRRRMAELEAKGELKDLNPNAECHPDERSEEGRLPHPYTVFRGEGNPEFHLTEEVGDGDTTCLSVKGSKNGTILFKIDDVMPDNSYAVSCRMKGGRPKAYVAWQSAEGKWMWGKGTFYLDFAPPDESGWQKGELFVSVPTGVNTAVLGLCPKMNDDETVFIDNVHVWRLW